MMFRRTNTQAITMMMTSILLLFLTTVLMTMTTTVTCTALSSSTMTQATEAMRIRLVNSIPGSSSSHKNSFRSSKYSKIAPSTRTTNEYKYSKKNKKQYINNNNESDDDRISFSPSFSPFSDDIPSIIEFQSENPSVLSSSLSPSSVVPSNSPLLTVSPTPAPSSNISYNNNGPTTTPAPTSYDDSNDEPSMVPTTPNNVMSCTDDVDFRFKDEQAMDCTFLLNQKYAAQNGILLQENV